MQINTGFVDNLIKKLDINLENVGIRALYRLALEIEKEYQKKDENFKFLHFEFGIPGLKAHQIALEAEKKVLIQDKANTYPPFDGVPRLKNASAEFVKNFLDLNVEPQHCIPTVGAMQGGFISLAVAGRRHKDKDAILFLDPGFPVNKLQVKVLGLKSSSIDLYDKRGDKLIETLEKKLIEENIGGVMWSNPNNPTWICLSEKELEKMGSLFDKHDVFAIEDLAYFGMDFRKNYGKPKIPPFQPTIGHFTENYFICISSSKIFSYAGQRIGITVISPKAAEKQYDNLENFFSTKDIGTAFIYGGLYATTSGVAQSVQNGLAALLESANKGDLDFTKDTKEYSERAKFIKKQFIQNGFHLVYNQDLGEPLADGFYFTIDKGDMNSGELLKNMLYFGMAGIPLKPTGSKQKGIRICVSMVGKDKFDELEKRIKSLNEYIH